MNDKFMVLSQCTQVNDGTAEHIKGEGETPIVGQYNGKDANIPVNLHAIASIKKDHSTHSAVCWEATVEIKPSFFVHFPRMVFTLPTPYEHFKSNTIVWWYPPTDEGIAMRDADYDFIISKFGLQCPSLSATKTEEELLMEMADDPLFQ